MSRSRTLRRLIRTGATAVHSTTIRAQLHHGLRFERSNAPSRCSPLCTALALLLLHETPTPRTLLGGAIIMAAVLFATRSRRES